MDTTTTATTEAASLAAEHVEVRRRHRFTMLGDAVIDDTRIGKHGLLAALALARFADRDGECFPSIPTLAAKARCGERQVREGLQELVEAGYLELERRTGVDGAPTSHLYTLNDTLRGVVPPRNQGGSPGEGEVDPSKKTSEEGARTRITGGLGSPAPSPTATISEAELHPRSTATVAPAGGGERRTTAEAFLTTMAETYHKATGATLALGQYRDGLLALAKAHGASEVLRVYSDVLRKRPDKALRWFVTDFSEERVAAGVAKVPSKATDHGACPGCGADLGPLTWCSRCGWDQHDLGNTVGLAEAADLGELTAHLPARVAVPA